MKPLTTNRARALLLFLWVLLVVWVLLSSWGGFWWWLAEHLNNLTLLVLQKAESLS